MKKLTYPVTKNGENVEIIFHIFGDGITTDLTPNWGTYGYFIFYKIDDYIPSLIGFKEIYNNRFQSFTNCLFYYLLSYDIVSDIQKAYADNKLEFPNEKSDFITHFTDVNEMQLVAFQTENQKLMKWFFNLNGENTDSGLVANTALPDDMLMLLLRRNPHRYIEFINNNLVFSKRTKQILDLLIEVDVRLVCDIAMTKNLDERSLCYILPYLNGHAFYDLVASNAITQYMLESYIYLDKLDDLFDDMTIDYCNDNLQFLFDRLCELANKFKQN